MASGRGASRSQRTTGSTAMDDTGNNLDWTQQVRQRPRGWYLPVKRLVDVVAATVALVLLSPILLGAWAAIKLTGGGPVLFTQTRIGMDERPFRVLKFRSMRADRTPDPKETVPLDHPEITRLGRLLRRTKIDELPQIFNVLLGDMSIIGPRPTLPDQVERYSEFERQRLWVRPGCTGLAQISGGATISWPERIRWDVYYVHHLSAGLDLQILFRTPIAILLGEKRIARHLNEADTTVPNKGS